MNKLYFNSKVRALFINTNVQLTTKPAMPKPDSLSRAAASVQTNPDKKKQRRNKAGIQKHKHREPPRLQRQSLMSGSIEPAAPLGLKEETKLPDPDDAVRLQAVMNQDQNDPPGIAALQGEQGPRGHRGKTGPRGPRGEPGPQGIPGIGACPCRLHAWAQIINGLKGITVKELLTTDPLNGKYTDASMVSVEESILHFTSRGQGHYVPLWHVAGMELWSEDAGNVESIESSINTCSDCLESSLQRLMQSWAGQSVMDFDTLAEQWNHIENAQLSYAGSGLAIFRTREIIYLAAVSCISAISNVRSLRS